MEINERTKIPLFAVLSAAPVILGGVFWLTAISFKSDQALAENIKQEKTLDEHTKTLKNIERIVIRIEERQNKGEEYGVPKRNSRSR